MPNKSYDIDQCTSSLKSEVTILTVVAVVLLILFVTVLVFSIRQIKNDKTKKLPYVQIIAALIIFIFLSVSLGTQIASYSKDLSQNSFVQYEGMAKIHTKKQLILGGIPTGYTEYVISFELDGEQIDLYMRKDPGFVGEVDNVFVVYAKYSKHIINFEITQ